MEVSLLHHVAIVLLIIWLLAVYGHSQLIAYLLSLGYLYLVHEKYVIRLRKKLQYEERKNTYQKRLLSDAETVRWLNHAFEKMWPLCMERIASQNVLLPIVPWFLDKFKPWTAKKAVVQSMYLGRNPPLLTEIKVLQNNTGDDHLVMELGMNFCTADDMSAILAVQLRKRLGLGMWTKLHVTGMNIEGKVLVGVKFLRSWPFIGRLRICFSEPPYFQITVKPIFNRGLDVTEVPGIAGWLDNLLSIAFEQTLVQPNMLVVDVEKFASSQQDDWFCMDEKVPIAHITVEIIEASDMKPSDLNGLSDPYVKGKIGPHTFKTKIQKKTLFPKWREEFKIPIFTWELPNDLSLEVFDKDTIFDDALGNCTVQINDLRDGERHDMWLPLENIKMGRLHIAITVTVPVEDKDGGKSYGEDKWEMEEDELGEKISSSTLLSGKSFKVEDNLEPIEVEGQEKTGIWIHRPGSEITQTWEPRKGKNRQRDCPIQGQTAESVESGSSSLDENPDRKKRRNKVKRGLKKIGTIFVKNKQDETLSPSPYGKESGVKLVVEEGSVCEENEGKKVLEDSPKKSPMKTMAENVLKQARSFKYSLSMKGSKNLPYQDRDLRSVSSGDESRVSTQNNPLSPSVPSVSFSSGEVGKSQLP